MLRMLRLAGSVGSPFYQALWSKADGKLLFQSLYSTAGPTSSREEADEDGDKVKDPQQRMYGYAKRLEFKNRLKRDRSCEAELRERVYRRTLTAEESLLAVDLLRKHKAMTRDAKKLRRIHRDSPQKAQRIASFNPLPFAHCDPTSHRVVRSIVHQLKKEDAEEKEIEAMKIEASQLMQIPEEENESVGSLESLKLRYGTPRPPRPLRHIASFDLPLSRPNTQAFHEHRPESMTILDMHFAEWFIGLTEAQLPFKYTAEGRPYFAVEHMDMQLFRRMRSMLHFGHVDDTKQVWYVLDDANLQRIIHLLNGNLFLEKTRHEFKIWVEKYKALGVWKEDVKVLDTCDWQPQLNNKWLMGFIDSSLGLFAGRFVEADSIPFFRIHLKFWILSSDLKLLEHLQYIFGGGEIEEEGDTFRWTIKDRKNHIKINRYCRMFRPYSLKNVNLVRYDRLVNYPIVKVKTQKAWKKLQKLIENLNTYERRCALAMRFHPYHQRYRQNAETQIHLARRGAPKEEIQAFKTKQEQKDFPLWDTSQPLTLISEVD